MKEKKEISDRVLNLKKKIDEGKIDLAILDLEDYIQTDDSDRVEDKDYAYYLIGNAYRKKGDFQNAMNNYQRSIDINPNSPAVEALKMLQSILNFYNKDMFNH